MNKGDKIRVTFDATYYGPSIRSSKLLVEHPGEEGQSIKFSIPASSTIEVLVPVTGPDEDPVGTVRQNTGALGGVYVKHPNGWQHLVHGFVPLIGTDTIGPVVGVVPGSPAAQALK